RVAQEVVHTLNERTMPVGLAQALVQKGSGEIEAPLDGQLRQGLPRQFGPGATFRPIRRLRQQVLLILGDDPTRFTHGTWAFLETAILLSTRYLARQTYDIRYG